MLVDAIKNSTTADVGTKSENRRLENVIFQHVHKYNLLIFTQPGPHLSSQKSKPRFIQEKARFNRDEYNFNGIHRDLSEILS